MRNYNILQLNKVEGKLRHFQDYRPQVKFRFSEMQTSGQQKFLNNDIVYPGESIIAEISLITSDFLKEMLKVGSDFDFREGSRIIGTGRILEILNQELLTKLPFTFRLLPFSFYLF